MTVFAFDLALDLASLTPREVVELGESVDGEDKVPCEKGATQRCEVLERCATSRRTNGKGNEVDEHPSDVDDLERRDEDEYGGKTEHGTEEEKRDGVGEVGGRDEGLRRRMTKVSGGSESLTGQRMNAHN